jgi:hypothetical protein
MTLHRVSVVWVFTAGFSLDSVGFGSLAAVDRLSEDTRVALGGMAFRTGDHNAKAL